jgi:TetR/AcrR family transcriptional repressor of bet genes
MARHEEKVDSIDWVYNQSMGRPSLRTQRRAEITAAFARVLAREGYAGATMDALAAEAGVARGLVHHHFRDKADLLDSLLDHLVRGFRSRVSRLSDDRDALRAYADAAVALDGSADVVAARCWVGVLAEAVRDPTLFAKVRRLVDLEITAVERRAGGRLDTRAAGAVLAFVVGALVVGAFAPRKTAGFAAPALHLLVEALADARARHR